MPALPRRRPELLVDTVDGETLVWDPSRDQALTLTATGGAVLTACDGTTDAHSLGLSPAEVDVVLTELREAGLLQAEDGLTRRRMLQRSAIVGGVVLAAVAVPHAAAAQSAPTNGGGEEPPTDSELPVDLEDLPDADDLPGLEDLPPVQNPLGQR